MKYLLLLLLIFPEMVFAQGPIDGYMRGKNETDIALTYAYEKYTQYWFGSELQDRELTTKTASFYVAHGLGSRFNLIVSVPYVWTLDEKSLQDAILAIKFRNEAKEYSHGKLSKITGIGFSFPIGDYDINAENPIGEKAVSFLLRYLMQYQSNQGWFVHLQSGMEFRFVPIAKLGIPVVFKAGWGGRKLYFDAWLDFFHTFNSGINQSITAGEGSQFLKIGGTIYYGITPHFGVFVGGAKFLSGKNIGKANRVNLGVVWKNFR
jgi:hypothetical protein